MADPTPQQIFDGFERSRDNVKYGHESLELFRKIQNKEPFLEPSIKFIEVEVRDPVRSWGTNILAMIGGDRAFLTLEGLLSEDDPEEAKRTYLWTRYFALKNLNSLATTEAQQEEMDERCQRIWDDHEEDYLLRSEAAALLAAKGQREYLNWLQEMLIKYDEFWPILRSLRPLRDVPLKDLTDDVLAVFTHSKYLEHHFQAIRTLEKYPANLKVLRELGDIVLTNPTNYLRLQAVISLGELADPQAQTELFRALLDEDAEIRYQAAIALKKTISPIQASAAIIQSALNPDLSKEERKKLIEALRQIDPSRAAPTEILSRELISEDRQRAEIAEELLVDLGGWGAIQRLSQRRLTLNKLDELLSESEAIVRSIFSDTIRQARLNFYFAMAVNLIVVITGVILVGLAIWQLIENPQNLAAWILPGATGLIGVLINLVFNNPRKNARDDLIALMDITVIFLGFLRQLNQIDATFKHGYMEDPEFGTKQMQETVSEIENAINHTLEVTKGHMKQK
jgi:HEAT repeat protein